MAKIQKHLVCIVLIVLTFTCACNSIEEKSAKMKSAPINLNLANMQCWDADTIVVNKPWESKPLKLCVFVNENFCTSCYLKKMFQWEDFLKLEKEYNFFIYFIFEPQEGCEDTFHKFFYLAELDHPLYLDKNREFLKINPNIPKEYMFHTFLLDENNNVILVGDVLHNTTIENEFMNILRDRANSKKKAQRP